jgi:Protein of unknown function (DUF2370)
VNAHDDENIDEDHDTPITPSSPPPSFRSGASSPTFRRLLSRDDPLHNEADQTLADTFDDGECSDAEDGSDDRQRLMRADPDAAAREAEEQKPTNTTTTTTTTATQRAPIQRRVTELPVFTPTPPRQQQPRGNNDGVFANLAAKPERGDTGDEKPPVCLSAHLLPTPSTPSHQTNHH